MANTMTVSAKARGMKQFRGVYKELWEVTVTTAFDTAITAGAEVEFDLTVPGLALGDHVLSWGVNADPEENIFLVNLGVSAANTLSVGISNMSGSDDTPAWTSMKVVVARPAW